MRSSSSASGRAAAGACRADVVAICSEAAATLGFEPLCQFRGPVDTAVTEEVAGHLVLALREVLSNVTRHAQASSVAVMVSVDADALVLEVVDDGVGVPADATGTGRGLDNLRHRAGALGGTFTIAPGDQGGTVARWAVLLADQPGDM